MASLSRDLRRHLEKTIAGENGARQIAEEGAEQSLQRLAVASARAHDSLTEAEKTFRVNLRRHAQQRGDRLNERPSHLIQEIAYEHWHRMLFARFLAENDLLLHPEHGVSLSLDEVKELALGLKRDWIEVAAEYAQRMLLREVFRPDDPALRVPLPPEKRLELEGKLTSLPREVFLADDSLGWVYQFWQRDAKDAVNRSEVKIGADELAPVTQLFTEDYMVLFLLENTLGAWWTAHRDTPELPGYTWTYLRLNDNGSPCAGTFDGWPKSAKDLKVLDPCMGSGHFLAFALPIIVRMRAAEEGLSLSEAVAAVLRDNLFGLELDPRCSQIGAFNLALTAWKLAGRHFELPVLNMACSGLGINAKEEDWIRLAGADGRKQDLMRWLYSLFSNAPTLGSLIDPRQVGRPMVENEIADLLPAMEQALAREQSSDENRELAIAASGLLVAGRILSHKYTLVTTNVPFLLRRKQSQVLLDYGDSCPNSKADLATLMVSRCVRLVATGGSLGLVAPQNWLYLGTYEQLRQSLLRSMSWRFVSWLGPGAFGEISGEVVKPVLLVLTDEGSSGGSCIATIDASKADSIPAKASILSSGTFVLTQQSQVLSGPEARLSVGINGGGELLEVFVQSINGMTTGDLPRLTANFWEIPAISARWKPLQTTPDASLPVSGCNGILRWTDGKGLPEMLPGSFLRGLPAWGRRGIIVRQTGEIKVALYFGVAFEVSTAVLLPRRNEDLAAVWAYVSSPTYNADVRAIDPSLKVTNATLAKVPFDVAQWRGIAGELHPDGLPAAISSDPTQWLFNGSPRNSDHPLQVAIARLVGYSWPRQTGSQFLDSASLDPDGLEAHSAADGIVCLPALSGEESAAVRLRALLRSSMGSDYNLVSLLHNKRSRSFEEWIRDEFFADHCTVFGGRPFVWHIWDGLKDGFHALVNYHKLDRKTLEKLIYSYLGDWLTRQRQDLENGVEGADTRLAAAEHLQGELKKIIAGVPPYDIFVRWKPLKEQPIGWEPDLNDGVRVNIRPWITEARLYNATKPGILRVAPSIKYTKDRGKEPARDPKEFPWFKGSTDRINDYHISLKEKRGARGL